MEDMVYGLRRRPAVSLSPALRMHSECHRSGRRQTLINCGHLYLLLQVLSPGNMTISQGTQFGPYKILEQIGSGGMGDVYRAQDTRLGREVAIKLVSDRYLAEAFGSGSTVPGMAGPAIGIATAPGTLSHRRFLREAQSASVLNHPNICTVYDIGEQGGRPYLVMELLRGETLREALRRGPLSATEVVTYSRQGAAALATAHAQGIVHRDIKPANIFVSEGARGPKQIKILDFGLAKQQGGDSQESSQVASFAGLATSPGTGPADLTSPGSTLGTVAYMSPEQAKGEPLDARTDLFSLGVVIYEMATGAKPFAAQSTAELFAALLTRDPAQVSAVNPAMPAELDGIVARLLAKEKQQRYQTAEELLQDLEAVDAQASHAPSGNVTAASGTHAAAPAETQHVPSTEKARPRRMPLLLAAGLIVLLLAAAFAWWKHRAAATPATATAPPTPSSSAAEAKNAIIVADFVNNTGDRVFETTLNQALGVQLGQSPVLDIVSPQHLRQSIQYLGKKPDDAITPAVAREIGEREGIKAILTGTIANLGSDYIITLSAQNTATGDQIASVQTQAASKEKVLDALNEAAVQMRARLGESLASIQKLNTPFGQATTPSLEAFRAYALGDQAHSKANDIPEAEDHYKRALALDPKLAMAWARLGVIYLNSGQTGKAMEYFTRAHELSGDVSERERLYIEGHYYGEVVGDLDKAIETLQVAVQEYPLQLDNYVNLGVFYEEEAKPENAEEVLLKALALQPDEAIGLSDVISSYTVSDQFDQARKYVATANQLRLNETDMLDYEMSLYGAIGDTAAVQRILAQGAGRPDQFILTGQWGNIQAERGQFRAATTSLQQAAGQAGDAKAPDAQAGLLLNAAYIVWPLGQCQNAETAVKQALALDKSKPTQIGVATTHAFCGAGKLALAELDVLEKKYPEGTLLQQAILPQARAYIALAAGDAHKALDLLAKGQAFDLASPGPYLRGLAYLQLHDAGNAIAAFKIATKYKGASYTNISNSPFPLNNYALCLLGLGRAYAMAGDKTDAKATYERFFAEWKEADADLAVMAQAKKEYAAL
jgi:eukaryotic-like serine/threonine-protein kinase